MGSEVKIYSAGVLVSSAQVMSGEILESDYVMYVSSGGTAADTDVNTYGSMYISEGGIATGTDVNYFGQMDVAGGGTATGITVAQGGKLYVSSGGTAAGIVADSGAHLLLAVAPDTHIQGTSAGCAFEIKDSFLADYTIEEWSYLDVFSGCTANNITVNSGWLHVHDGAVVNDTVAVGGGVYVQAGGRAENTTVDSGASMQINSGGTAAGIAAEAGAVLNFTVTSDTYIQGTSDGVAFEAKDALISGYAVSGGHLDVCSGGTASDTTVNSGGRLFVFDDGIADGTTVNSGGIMHVSRGGAADDTTVNAGGQQCIYSDGTANGAVVNSDGQLVVAGGAAHLITVDSGGQLVVSGGAAATDAVISSGGDLVVFKGGTAAGIAAEAGATMWLAVAPDTYIQGTSAGVAFEVNDAGISGFAVASGVYLLVSEGGIADGNTVNADGYLVVSEGGTADGTTVNAKGNLVVYGGGEASRTTVGPWGYFYTFGGAVSSTAVSGGYVFVSGGVVDGTVISGGWVHVYDGGTADNTIINQYGNLYVYEGGTATGVDIGVDGVLHVSEGGAVGDATILGGSMFVSGGVVDGTVISGGWLHVSSGGTADNTTINQYGNLHVSDGGTATGVDIGPEGVLHVSEGGTVEDATIRGGSMYVSGGVVDSTVISGGYMHVSEGGTADNTTINQYGNLHVHEGGTAYSTAINSGGHLWVSSGGTADNTTVNYSGGLTVCDGGSTNDTTINICGWMAVSSGGIAVNTAIISSCGLLVHHGGLADATTINSHGWLSLRSGGTVTNTVINAWGILHASNGGTAYSTAINSGGHLWVSSGGTANGAVLNYCGWLEIYEGGIFSGNMQIAEGAVVSAYSGAKIDFTVADQTDPTVALINDWSLIDGGNLADYTITVASDQAEGIYLLAGGAADFDRTVTVKTASGTELGTVTVGETLETACARYTLDNADGALSLAVVQVSTTVAGSFGGVGGAFQLFDDGSAVVRAASGRTALEGTIDPDQWEIIGAGDFSGGGTDGLLWLEKDTGYVYMQNDMTAFDEVNNRTNCLGAAVEGYTLKAAGDFTGNGIEGALLQGPAFGDPEISLNYGLPVWARNDDGSAFNGWLGALVNTWQPGDPLEGDPADPADINAKNYKYDVIGVGDFNGDGVDDVMLQNTMPTEVDGVVITGSGDVFTFLTGDKAAIIAGDPPTVCYAGCATGGWEVVGFGDFDGDGIDDALLSDGTGVAGWSMTDGQRQSDLWFGNLAAGDEIAGIADVDGDSTDDILIRSTATETLTAWLVQDGAVTGTLAIA